MTPTPTIPSSPPHVTLRQIAAWDLKHLDAPCDIRVGVPALQRGLVWDPARVELLWDSIFRGFPVGSLVITPMVNAQQRDGATGITHHLLDGQQRCNAITLGFHDPFDDSGDTVRGNCGDAILWLDLAPCGSKQFPTARIPGNSTRQFLFRVTNRAHPWGFTANDNAGAIRSQEMHDSLEWRKTPSSETHGRPEPTELCPFISNAPVPLAWLVRAIDASDDETCFWEAIVNKLNALGANYPWAVETLGFLKSEIPGQSAPLSAIFRGLVMARKAVLVALEAADDLSTPSAREARNPEDQSDGISNIEHLFSRLNQQGVRLDGEELAYSLIKAYWPEAAPAIEAVPRRRIPASKLASLAIRAALTECGDERLMGAMGIPQIRAMARAEEGREEASATEQKRRENRRKVLTFLGADSDSTSPLAAACDRVDRWLTYDKDNHPQGLPPVLVSSVARSSTDVYLLLLVLAKNPAVLSSEDTLEWRRAVTGFATLVHWFGDDKGKIGNAVWNACRGGASVSAFREGLEYAVDAGWLGLPLSPVSLTRHMELPEDDERLKNWRWWPSLIGSKPEEVRDAWGRYLWTTVARTKGQNELLLYAQRRYLAERFPNYDPSRKDLWESHNRPWDFDHLHAHKYFYDKRDGSPFRVLCIEFGNTIGNLRAWPMEENRSDQALPASKKMDTEQMEQSLVEGMDELKAFSHGDESRREKDKASAFCRATRDRYLRIYRNWYVSTGIGDLVREPEVPIANAGASIT